MTEERGVFRYVHDPARPARLLQRWRLGRLASAVLAPMGAMPRFFERSLAAALARGRAGEAGFWVPQAYALRRFSSRLDLIVSAASIRELLLDVVALHGHHFHTGQSFIGAGDWSQVLLPFARHQITREARELKAAELRFRETRCYAAYRLRAEAGRPMVRNRLVLDTPAAVDAYFDGFVALFESIAEHGLRRRADFVARAGWQAGRRRWLAELGEQDVGVALAADGRLVKLPGGQHRFAIARALGLKEVPVELRLLHVDALQGMSASALIELIDAGRVFQICNIREPRPGRIMPRL